jgi:predicted ATPase
MAWTADDLRQIARICRLVDGMPLGIELAATWLGTLRLEEIADEIEHDLDILGIERQDIPLSQRSIGLPLTAPGIY